MSKELIEFSLITKRFKRPERQWGSTPDISGMFIKLGLQHLEKRKAMVSLMRDGLMPEEPMRKAQ